MQDVENVSTSTVYPLDTHCQGNVPSILPSPFQVNVSYLAPASLALLTGELLGLFCHPELPGGHSQASLGGNETMLTTVNRKSALHSHTRSRNDTHVQATT